MLRKLGSYPRQNGLALALRELGRIERTLFTQEWMMDIDLRRRVAELRAVCDLSTLKLESGSFVEDDLRQYFSDVLYSLKTTCGDGYVHVLIEHQSSPGRHMAFRLIRYAVAAMQRHLEAGHKKLPLVIPVLFYTGKRSPYPYSTRW